MKLSHIITKYLPLGVASSALAVAVVASPVALARHGSALEANPPVSGTATESETGDDSASGQTSLRSQAQSLLKTERQNHKEHTMARRQQACTVHQTEINNRVNNYATAAQRHLDTFTSIFTKVQAFQTSKQLTVSNYVTLVAAAQAKQTAAQSAVDALKALDVKIDCTQPDPATSLAAVKTAVKNARTALQDYRSAIKDVIVALKGGSTSTSDTSSTGGND